MARTRAFSLVELVIVTVIIGIIAAIAVPRFSRAAESARQGTLRATLARLQSAIDQYTAEHAGLSPGHDAPGSPSTSGADLVQRLLERTDEHGATTPTGIYGPYLRSMPVNPANGRRTVRIGGSPAGSNTHGWRFNPQTLQVQPDHGASISPDEEASGEIDALDVGTDAKHLGAGDIISID